MERNVPGFQAPELQGLPELPECAEHVWQWFHDISRGRTCGMSMMNPLTWQDIDSWSNRRKINPRQWELDSLLGIDVAYLNANAPET